MKDEIKKEVSELSQRQKIIIDDTALDILIFIRLFNKDIEEDLQLKFECLKNKSLSKIQTKIIKHLYNKKIEILNKVFQIKCEIEKEFSDVEQIYSYKEFLALKLSIDIQVLYDQFNKIKMIENAAFKSLKEIKDEL